MTNYCHTSYKMSFLDYNMFADGNIQSQKETDSQVRFCRVKEKLISRLHQIHHERRRAWRCELRQRSIEDCARLDLGGTIGRVFEHPES